MSRAAILDCTLRDGGYINEWQFGDKQIHGIISRLVASGVDIIECGFLRDEDYEKGRSVFSCVSQIKPYIAPKKEGVQYVAMIALGDIAPEKLLPYDGSSIDGIRLTFHKHEWESAKKAATQLMEKGYRVFVQPVGTTSYSDAELLQLIEEINLLQPFAFYLVDTLGILYRNELLRLFYLIDHNLAPQIKVGLHSHNNLQLSFSNAQELLRMNSRRDIILDASVYGMGRGVGNLSTELIAEYINVNIGQKYSIMPLLSIADQYLMSIYSEQRWGYDLPYFLSAAEKCHPNYASYLLKKETLNMEDISKILSLLPAGERDLYHSELIEEHYLTFQSCQIDDRGAVSSLAERLRGKNVLVLAPGAALHTHWRQVQEYIGREKPLVIAVNFIPEEPVPDILFISNRKRLDFLKGQICALPCVAATSNLMDELPKSVYFVNYASYLGEGRAADNAGAMLIRLLRKAGAAKVALAGFDGFDADPYSNYCIGIYKSVLERDAAAQKNEDISRQLKLALGGFPYEIVTPTRYQIE